MSLYKRKAITIRDNINSCSFHRHQDQRIYRRERVFLSIIRNQPTGKVRLGHLRQSSVKWTTKSPVQDCIREMQAQVSKEELGQTCFPKFLAQYKWSSLSNNNSLHILKWLSCWIMILKVHPKSLVMVVGTIMAIMLLWEPATKDRIHWMTYARMTPLSSFLLIMKRRIIGSPLISGVRNLVNLRNITTTMKNRWCLILRASLLIENSNSTITLMIINSSNISGRGPAVISDARGSPTLNPRSWNLSLKIGKNWKGNLTLSKVLLSRRLIRSTEKCYQKRTRLCWKKKSTGKRKWAPLISFWTLNKSRYS